MNCQCLSFLYQDSSFRQVACETSSTCTVYSPFLLWEAIMSIRFDILISLVYKDGSPFRLFGQISSSGQAASFVLPLSSHSFFEPEQRSCANMHFTFTSLASALSVSSLIVSASARVAADKRGLFLNPDLIRRQVDTETSTETFTSTATTTLLLATGPAPQYCTVDDVLGPLTSYLPISVDATSFCSSFISIGNYTSYVATVTPRS